jgi:hypothetical protein
MSINKIMFALAIISLSAGLSSTKAAAQTVQPESKPHVHILPSNAEFNASAEFDSDAGDSSVHLSKITVTTEGRNVPVVIPVDSSNNLPNQLSVGTGICARAGYKSIGWVDNYAASSGQPRPADEGTVAVRLDSSGKISKRIAGTVTDATVTGVYCIVSMDAATNYSCQFSTAKNIKPGSSEADTQEQFGLQAQACKDKQAASAAPAVAPAAPAAVIAPAVDVTSIVQQPQL